MILRVPEIFEDSTNALSKFKYNYRLSREASVLDKKYVEDKLIRPVTYNLTVGKEKWKLEIMSRAGWSNSTTLYLIFFGGQSLVLLLTGLTIVLFLMDERRVELKELANKDGLTKLYNRYGFDEMAEKMISKNPKEHCVAVLLDVDDFKLINDMYGHAYGDEVIRMIAQIMEQNKGSKGFVARYGGEEFAMIFPKKAIQEAVLAADNIRREFASRTLESKDGPKSFTISIGVAEYDHTYRTASAFFEEADQALYKAKATGKNKVCCNTK